MVVDETIEEVKADLASGQPTANVLFSLDEANLESRLLEEVGTLFL